MFVLQLMSAAMEFVPLVCLSLVTWSGITSADGPTVVQQVVEEDGDAVLSCSFGENIKGKLFDWRKDGDTDVFLHESDGQLIPAPSFKDRVSHFPDALQSGNASIVIRGTKVSDSGNYTCDFPDERPKTRSTISLTVEQILKDRSSEKISGSAQRPVITILGQTERGVLLQCEVLGASPKPDVKWQDSDGTVLQAEEPQVTQRDGKYDVILNITVTKSDTFSCISTQEDIHHQSRAQTFVPPIGPTVVQQVEEDGDAVLSCSFGKNAEGKIFDWRKDGDTDVFLHESDGQLIPGPSFQDRVSHFPEALQSGNASIVIRGTKVSDSGIYTCDFPNDPPERRSTISLTVGPTVVQQVVKEDGDVVLSCSFGKNAEGKTFDWRKDGDTDVFFHGSDGTLRPGPSFQGRVSHFPEAPQSGNASIVIRGTKVSDSGKYTCDFPNDRPMRRSIISLTVERMLKDRSAEKIAGAAAKPSIRTFGRTERGVLLQCEVLGASPKPDVKWQDSDGTVLQAEEPQVTQRDRKYDVILKITVTKSDTFSCISTQKDIHHQISSPAFVYLCGLSTGAVAGLALGAVLLVVVTAVVTVLIHKCYIQRKLRGGNNWEDVL